MAGYVRDPRAYELMVIIVPDISDEETVAELGRVQTYLGDIDAEVKEILTDSPWGRRRLAYTIRFNGIDYRDGYYAVIHFSARPDRLGDLERELKLDTKVVRYLLVHDDPKAGVREPNNPDRAAETAETPATPSAPAEAETTEAPVASVEAEVAPVVEDVAPVAEDVVPAVEDVAPATEDVVADAPAVEESAPAATEDAPAETSEEE